MTETMIQIDQVFYEYIQESRDEDKPIRNRAVRGISLEVRKGEFVALLGHNGSGKSTLCRMLNGLILPSSGRVEICGMDTRDENLLWDIRSRCGMVFQNPDNQTVTSIVEEDVAFGPENLGVPQEELRHRVDQALEAVGMSAFKERAPHTLSGGQKQRIAIAGILAMNPDIIVLDEPTAMLDPEGRAEIIHTIEALHADGKTIVYVTHYMEEAVRADRVVVLDQGQIALEGKPKEVFSEIETMRKLRLDVPQVSELAYLLKSRGLKVPHCMTVDDLVRAL